MKTYIKHFIAHNSRYIVRIVIGEKNENLETKEKILDKVNNELAENLCEWYDDEEMSYNSENELSQC